MFKRAKSRQRKWSEALSITLVTSNGAVLADLTRYLQAAGVSVRPSSVVDRALHVVRTDDAIVVFPDEFAPSDMHVLVSTLAADERNPLLMLVTANEAAYARMGATRPHMRVVVLPRPAWGWSILDAVRSCVERPVSLRNVS